MAKSSEFINGGKPVTASAASGTPFDQVLVDAANYVMDFEVRNPEAWRMARYCVMDTLGCAVAALNVPECIKLLGPPVPGMNCQHGARVPGTQYELDPVNAAFNMGTAARWLELNDTFSAVEGGHPSDNICGILMTADWLSRRNVAEGRPALTMRDVLAAVIKAYEVQGMLQMENSFSGYDHIMLPRIASTGVITKMLGGGYREVVNAFSNAWVDGVHLKVYRQGDNTGSRKSWAAGDAGARAVRLALIAVTGEMGYPTALTAPKWGFYDSLFKGKPFRFQRPYGSYVIENAIFKFVPAGNHGQTAVECAFKLHPLVKDRIDEIQSVLFKTQDKLMTIMDKKGPLTNPAARDHCAQYIVAVGMIYGHLGIEDFSDEFAADPRIDALREKMTVVEDPRYSREFLDPEKRSKTNGLQVTFKDGSTLPLVEVEYTIGHPRRRPEGILMVEEKFRRHLKRRFPPWRQENIIGLFADQARFEAMPVHQFVQSFII